ncbi:MAG: hypothetical protein ACYCS8_11530 [Acidithiobacillus sp.]
MIASKGLLGYPMCPLEVAPQGKDCQLNVDIEIRKKGQSAANRIHSAHRTSSQIHGTHQLRVGAHSLSISRVDGHYREFWRLGGLGQTSKKKGKVGREASGGAGPARVHLGQG